MGTQTHSHSYPSSAQFYLWVGTKGCTVGMAPSSPPSYPRVVHKKSATFEWHLPRLNFTLGWLTKGLRHLLHLNFALGWLTKGLLSRNGAFLFKFIVRWLTHGLLPWNDTFRPQLFLSCGSQNVCHPFPLDFTLQWLTKGLRRWKGAFFI